MEKKRNRRKHCDVMGTVGGRVDGLEKNIDLAPDVIGG
jgi:hypothetical protein